MGPLIELLRREFRDLLAATDYELDLPLVRAAVRQYLKARARVLKRDADPAQHAQHVKRKRESMRRLRAGLARARGKDVVLKPQRGRRRLPEVEESYRVVWSGSAPLMRWPDE